MRFFLVGNITQKWIAGPAVQGNRVLRRHRRKVPEKTVSGPKRSFGPDTVFSGDSSMPSVEDAIALARGYLSPRRSFVGAKPPRRGGWPVHELVADASPWQPSNAIAPRSGSCQGSPAVVNSANFGSKEETI